MEIIIERSFPGSQCEWEKDEDCFKDSIWFIEGGSYCQKHGDKVIQLLKNQGYVITFKRRSNGDLRVERRSEWKQ